MPNSALPNSPDDRLNRLERQIAALHTQLSRRSRITGCVALVLLIVLAGYFYFGYKNFDEVTRPEMVVQVAETFVDTNLPELRKSLQAEIIRSAPGWAEQLSLELQASMPQARAQLEDYIIDQMDTVLHETNALSQEQFRSFLRENRPALERGFKDLAQSPTMAEETMKQVIDGLDKQLSPQMQLESSDLFETVSMMKKKLDRLKSAQNLTNEQQLERRVLMVTRRLQLETVEPGTLRGQAAAQSKPAVVATTEEASESADEPSRDAPKPEGDTNGESKKPEP
jgi:hypothetical protein